MKNTYKICILVFIGMFLLFFCGCGKPPRVKVGLIDPARLVSGWPKYQEMAIKFQEETIEMDSSLPKDLSKVSAEKKQKIIEAGAKWQKIGKELSEEIRKAAELAAKKKKINLIVVGSVVEYGGEDITEDVKTYLR